MELFELIQKLTVLHGPSGREQAVSNAIAELARPYADEIITDTMGNLIIHKKGEGPKLMLAAHMDSIGFVASYIEDSGMIRAGGLGSLLPEDARNAVVRFENGTLGTVKVDGGADEKNLHMDDLYIDIGASSREEAKAMISLGDTAVYAGHPHRTGDRIIGSCLNNRVSCAVLLKVLEELKHHFYDLYIAFTVQEEVGLRGAKTAAFGIEPELSIVLDTIDVMDWPGAKKVCGTALGGGAAVKVMDKSIICHPAVVEKLTDLAKADQISHQLHVSTSGSTDAGAIYKSRSGVKTGVISVPCRYLHTPTEMVQLSDVNDCIKLTAALVSSEP